MGMEQNIRMKLIQENNGKDSSFRVVFLMMAVYVGWNMWLFSLGFMQEIRTPPIDWLGMTGYSTGVFGGGAFLMWFKTLHKKYEK